MNLTSRERDVMRLFVTGLLNKQVAAELGTARSRSKLSADKSCERSQAASVAEPVRMVEKPSADR
jgi:FixJ family two-component response regulator